MGLIHRVFNRPNGFISEDGTHTNNIECFWSHLKGIMRKENGVTKENIDNRLTKYILNADI